MRVCVRACWDTLFHLQATVSQSTTAAATPALTGSIVVAHHNNRIQATMPHAIEWESTMYFGVRSTTMATYQPNSQSHFFVGNGNRFHLVMCVPSVDCLCTCIKIFSHSSSSTVCTWHFVTLFHLWLFFFCASNICFSLDLFFLLSYLHIILVLRSFKSHFNLQTVHAFEIFIIFDLDAINCTHNTYNWRIYYAFSLLLYVRLSRSKKKKRTRVKEYVVVVIYE